MMDSELKKSSIRANKLEKKRFEMMMSAFDSAKRNVAVDMKKSQLDFKRRLKRYKDRQREILTSRAGPSSTSMEEFVLKQLTRRNTVHHHHHHHPGQYGERRPQTCPHPSTCTSATAPKGQQGLGTVITTSSNSNNSNSNNNSSNSNNNNSNSSISNSRGSDGPAAAARVISSSEGSRPRATVTVGRQDRRRDLEEEEEEEEEERKKDEEEEEEEEEGEDFVKLSHCRRSKVDLRPCTAWSAVRRTYARADNLTSTTINSNNNTPRTHPHHPHPLPATSSSSGSLKLLQLRGGRLGTPARQVRYLNEEEIEERCTFYRFLLDGLRHLELQRLETLNDRVGEFCGSSGTGGGSGGGGGDGGSGGSGGGGGGGGGGSGGGIGGSGGGGTGGSKTVTSISTGSSTNNSGVGRSRQDSASGGGGGPPPPLIKKFGGMVVSLPAGVPPIIVQAMRVKIPHVNVLGHVTRAKTQ